MKKKPIQIAIFNPVFTNLFRNTILSFLKKI